MSALPSSTSSRQADARVQTWVELRFAKRPLTLDEIVLAVSDKAQARVNQFCGWIDRWIAAGLVHAVGLPPAYAMASTAKALRNPPPVAATGVLPPRAMRGQLRPPRARLWSAMRVLRRFDLVTLRMSADVSEQRAKDFIRTMTRAGYLRIIPAPTKHDTLSWALGPRAAGPIPPVVRHVRIDGQPFEQVADRNDGTVTNAPLRPHHPDRAASIPLDGGVS